MQISVGMGPTSTDWRDFPVARAIDMLHVPVTSGPLDDGLAMWIGNPHVVYFRRQRGCGRRRETCARNPERSAVS
jgi:diaminopimelate epimerase